MDKARELLHDCAAALETEVSESGDPDDHPIIRAHAKLAKRARAYLAQPEPPRAPPREPTRDAKQHEFARLLAAEYIRHYLYQTNPIGGADEAREQLAKLYAAPAAEPVAQQPPANVMAGHIDMAGNTNQPCAVCGCEEFVPRCLHCNAIPAATRDFENCGHCGAEVGTEDDSCLVCGYVRAQQPAGPVAQQPPLTPVETLAHEWVVADKEWRDPKIVGSTCRLIRAESAILEYLEPPTDRAASMNNGDDARDAARYRWLQAQIHMEGRAEVLILRQGQDWGAASAIIAGEQLDDAIDAAIAEQAKERT